MFDNLRKVGTHYEQIRNNPRELFSYTAAFAQRVPHWDHTSHQMCALESDFAVEWIRAGEIVYNLSHSLAALFTLTSAPDIDWNHLPHVAFIVQVPRLYLPLTGTIEPESSYLYVNTAGQFVDTLIVADFDTTAFAHFRCRKESGASTFFEENNKEGLVEAVQTAYIDHSRGRSEIVAWLQKDSASALLPLSELERVADRLLSVQEAQLAEKKRTAPVEMDAYFHGMNVLGMRFLANTLAYLNEAQPRSIMAASHNAQRRPRIMNMLPPRELVVQRAFRDAAADAVTAIVAGSIVGVRRAMKHHVRGHWRNQAVGPAHSQRRRIWILPHERGSQDFGTVVRRVETLDIPMEPTTN